MGSIDDAQIDLEVTAEGDQNQPLSILLSTAKHRWMVYGCGFVEGDHRPRIIHSGGVSVCACLRVPRIARIYSTDRENVGWRVVTIGPVVVLRLMFLHLSSMGKNPHRSAWWSIAVSCFSGGTGWGGGREIICDEFDDSIGTWKLGSRRISMSSWVNWHGK